MSTCIARERDGAVATVVLNRPEQRNALSLSLIEELTATLDELEQDESIRVVVLGARGPAFCAGHDLVEMRGKDEAFFQHLYGACTEMMLRLHRLSQPVIARVQGMASAGGCHLVAACDLVVASEQARFAVPGPRIGLPGTTGMVEVARAVGSRRAMELLLTGDPIDAREAQAWGLVNRIVPADDLKAHTSPLARRVAIGSRQVTEDAKRTLYEVAGGSRTTAYHRARDVMARSSAAPDAQEGIAAFLEKREPVWPSKSRS